MKEDQEKMKRERDETRCIFSKKKNVSRPSNPPDELAQNVSKKKSPSDELFLHFSAKVQNLAVFYYLHDSNSIFWPRELNQNGFSGARYFYESRSWFLCDDVGQFSRSVCIFRTPPLGAESLVVMPINLDDLWPYTSHLRARSPKQQQQYNLGRLRFNRRGASTPLWGVEACSLPSRRPNPIPAIQMSSGHHISMEHRLRRKQLNSDTNASNKTYLKEIQEKGKNKLFLRKK